MKKYRGLSFLSLLFVLAIFLAVACGSSTKKQDGNTTEDVSTDDGQGVGKYKNDEYAAIDEIQVAKGAEVFTAKCAACHKLTSDKVVGPGLLGVTKKRTASWLLNMITNPEEMTKKDPEAQKLLAEHLIQMTFQDVNDEQARQIVAFLQKNDNQ